MKNALTLSSLAFIGEGDCKASICPRANGTFCMDDQSSGGHRKLARKVPMLACQQLANFIEAANSRSESS